MDFSKLSKLMIVTMLFYLLPVGKERWWIVDDDVDDVVDDVVDEGVVEDISRETMNEIWYC